MNTVQIEMNRKDARCELSNAVELLRDELRHAEKHLQQFDECDTDEERAVVLRWAIERATRLLPNMRLSSIAESIATLTAQHHATGSK